MSRVVQLCQVVSGLRSGSWVPDLGPGVGKLVTSSLLDGIAPHYSTKWNSSSPSKKCGPGCLSEIILGLSAGSSKIILFDYFWRLFTRNPAQPLRCISEHWGENLACVAALPPTAIFCNANHSHIWITLSIK